MEKSKSSRRNNSEHGDRKRHEDASKKKSKKDKHKASLSSIQVEQVHLSAMLANLSTLSESESDLEEVKSSESITEQAILAA